MSRKGNKNDIKILIQKAEKNEKNEKYFDAIQDFEHAKFLIKNNINHDKSQLPVINKKICELSNMLSILFLQQANYKACLDLLQKAEECAKGSDECLALTYNNYACFYKSTGKYRVALNFLQEALIIEKKKQNNKNIADIFLNICAVLSKLQKHNEAFQASMNSIILIQEEILDYCIPIVFQKQKKQKENKKPRNQKIGNFRKTSDKSVNSLNLQVPKSFNYVKSTNFEQKNVTHTEAQITNKYKSHKIKKSSSNNMQEEQDPQKKNAILERVVILSIAYHNLAVELEHLRLYEDSMSTYQKAYNFSQSILGENADVVVNLQKILKNAQDQLHKKIKKKQTNKYRIQNKKRIFSNYHQKQRKLLLKKKPVSAFKQKQTKKDREDENHEIKNNPWNEEQMDFFEDEDDYDTLQNTVSQMKKSQNSIYQDKGVINVLKQKRQQDTQSIDLKSCIEEEPSQSEDETEQTKNQDQMESPKYNINISVSAIQQTDHFASEISKQDIMDQFRQKLSPQNLTPNYQNQKHVLFQQQTNKNSSKKTSKDISRASSDSKISEQSDKKVMTVEHKNALCYKKSFARGQDKQLSKEDLSSSSSNQQEESSEQLTEYYDCNKNQISYSSQYEKDKDESISHYRDDSQKNKSQNSFAIEENQDEDHIDSDINQLYQSIC